MGLFGCYFLKLFWKTVFKNSLLCFQKKKKKLCLGTEFCRTVFVLKNKKKTCLVESIKKFFRISKIKKHI